MVKLPSHHRNILIMFLTCLSHQLSSINAKVNYPRLVNKAPFTEVSTTNLAAHNMSLVGISWRNFVLSCGWTCLQNGTKIRVNECSSLYCFPCDCDETCTVIGTCCPTYNSDTDSYSYPYGSTPDTDPARWYGLVDCRLPYYGFMDIYLTVVKCPRSWVDGTERQKCENPSWDSMESITPVNDRTTGLVFRNIHCATCNGFQISASPSSSEMISDGPNKTDTDVAVPWRLMVKCDHYQNLYHFTDMFEFVRSAYQCIKEFLPPLVAESKGRPRTCTQVLDTTPDTSCRIGNNETRDLCKSLPPLPALVVEEFRNPFCAMCNGLNLQPPICLTPSSVGDNNSTLYNNSRENGFEEPFEPEFLPPMFLLFSPKSSTVEKRREIYKECPPGLWRNEEGNCTRPHCSAGKTLDVDNATCTTAIRHITGLGYSLVLTLRPLSPASRRYIDQLHARVVDRTTNSLGGLLELNMTFLIRSCDGIGRSQEDDPIVEVRLEGYIVGPDTVMRDDFEDMMKQQVLGSRWNLEINTTDGTNFPSSSMISLKLVSVGRDMNRLQKSTESRSHDTESLQNLASRRCHEDEIRMEIKQLPSDQVTMPILFLKDEFIDVSPSLTCPYVEVELIKSFLTEDELLSYTVTVLGNNVSIHQGPGISFQNDKLYICLHEYKTLSRKSSTNYYYRDETSTPLMKAVYYCEIICTLISVTCLAIAFVTYCTFPSLRTLAGRNNMCLCVSMATAQTSLLVTAVAGLKGHLSESHCLANGVIVHYSWLATFCWLNTSCIHMFRVFTESRGLRPYSDTKSHLLYSLYSFGVPVLFVVGTVVLTYGLTQGHDIGYSHTICFLDTPLSGLLVILPLLVPFCLTMVVNGGLFVLTMMKICSLSRHQESSRKSRDVMSYLRLSTVTGLFFVLEAIAVLTVQPVLMLLATPLMALQGLFIFLSFTANGAVWKLYQGLVYRRVTNESSSASRKNTS